MKIQKHIKATKLHEFQFNTKIGNITVIADENGLYILDFTDRNKLRARIHKLATQLKAEIVYGINHYIELAHKELSQYFNGNIIKFQTPIHIFGTSFQKLAWQKLQDIPYGNTISYLEQANIMRHNTAYRAIANANGANQIAIIIPCHRVIKNDGNIGGYGGGIERKKWLIEHESITLQKHNL